MAYMATRLPPAVTEYHLELAEIRLLAQKQADAFRTAARAVKIALESNYGRVGNNVCWSGSLRGFAELVSPACERAVRLDPDRPGYRDSRGLCRALLGDLAGAAEDFQFFIDNPSDDGSNTDALNQRREWIAEIEKGRNPIDAEVLASLRDTTG